MMKHKCSVKGCKSITQHKCLVDGCAKRVWARGLCPAHLSRLKKYGDPTAPNKRTKHGAWGKPLFQTWSNMIARCYDQKNQDYPGYGGRGIRVCDRWHESYDAFVSDMGLKPTSTHTIERNNNDGDYAHDNCRWATAAEQARNTRRNRYLTANGRTQLMEDWVFETGLRQSMIHKRLAMGWSEQDALTKPSQRT